MEWGGVGVGAGVRASVLTELVARLEGTLASIMARHRVSLINISRNHPGIPRHGHGPHLLQPECHLHLGRHPAAFPARGGLWGPTGRGFGKETTILARDSLTCRCRGFVSYVMRILARSPDRWSRVGGQEYRTSATTRMVRHLIVDPKI